jgi:predicted AlkP superfamily pyrophosphatase or phosphodiesterase
MSTQRKIMPSKKSLHSFFAYVVVFVLFSSSLAASMQQRRPAVRPTTASTKPKLVLLLVVDQFRGDYLERFSDLFGKDGFRRLMEGAFFTNANYDYVPTYTAPGHAAISTGSVPAQNGIVGNAWFDRETGKMRVMVSDLQAHLLTNKGAKAETGAASPRVLLGTSIGDQLRLSNNFQSKVVAISQKDRAAVLPGGQRPNGAFWFVAAEGGFVSSDYYFKELPGWVKDFNSKNSIDKYFGKMWDRVLPEASYARAQAKNLPLQITTLGTGFPYTITGGDSKPGAKYYSVFDLTPFASEHLEDFAKTAIEAEHLGEDNVTDLLSVSFSTPDLVGHSYGPDSQELLDTYIRLDHTVADLLNFIDRKVGLANTIVAVTGDHGVCPIPEYVQSMGFDAGRISGTMLVSTVKKALNDKYGEANWIQAFVNDQFYIDPKLIADRKINPADIERVAGEAAMTVPGIVNYYTRTQIVEGRMPATPVARRVVNGFNRQRSGDVCVVTKPFTFVAEGNLATTHGSPYNYDTHVPIIFYGKGIQPGRYEMESSPSDIAPTLASILGIEMPSNRVGHILPVQVQAMSAKQF